MTKKFLHTDKKANGASSRSEFIVPDIFELKSRLVGLETGTIYQCGLVVYTGLDLSPTDIFKKIEAKHPNTKIDKRQAELLISNFLIQLKAAKIGKKLAMDTQFGLIETK
jgi:hypothetical protein